MKLTDRAYALLHDKLTAGQIPPGTRLTNRAVAKEMGTSLTPVHCAFNRLITEGLLEYRPGIGVLVPASNRREIEEVYEFRELLECGAVARVCGNLSDHFVNELRGCLEKLTEASGEVEQCGGAMPDRDQMDKARTTDMNFHMSLMRSTGNRRMLLAAEDCWVRMQMMEYWFFDERPTNLRRIIDEHTRIFEAISTGNSAEACKRISEHIRLGYRYALEAYDRHYMEHGSRADRF